MQFNPPSASQNRLLSKDAQAVIDAEFTEINPKPDKDRQRWKAGIAQWFRRLRFPR
jgi:hypothetical protein